MHPDINELAFAIHSNARNKGFWDADTEENRTIFYLKQIAMIHSECSETLEAIRKEMGDDVVVEELADIIIRVLDLWAGMSIDQYTNHSLKDAVYNKEKKNQDRPRMNGALA